MSSSGIRTKCDRWVQQSVSSRRTYGELTLDLCAKKIGGGSRKEGGTAEQLNGIKVDLHKLEATKSECLLVKRQRASTSCPRSELCDQCVRE
jgi:hypothetical protein